MSISELGRESPAPKPPFETRARPEAPRLLPAVVALTLAGTLAAAASVTLARGSGLWLDEAQSVAIASLPPGELLQALREDGSPPLYYVLLRGWILLFGAGDTAVRSLSALFAVATVPLAMVAAARLLGRRAALPAGALLVTGPFFLRYASETRMYSLVVLLVAAGAVALLAVLRRPRTPALVVLVGVTAALVLTHYWSFFLVGPVLAALAVRAVSDRAACAAAAAGGAGLIVFLPWVPSFLFQLAHTGAPWGSPPGPEIFEVTLHGFAMGPGRAGVLGFVYAALLLLGLFGTGTVGDRIVLDLRARHVGSLLAVLVAVPLLLGLLASILASSAYAQRYAAVVYVPFVLLLARGAALVCPATLARVALAGVVALGAVRSVIAVSAPRTQGGQLAAAIDARAGSDDVVAVCPDQLAPALARRLRSDLPVVTFPPGSEPERMRWVDYRERIRASSPRDLAQAVAARAGAGGAVWYVTTTGYRPLGRSCSVLLQELEQLRGEPSRVVARDRDAYERAALWRFAGPTTTERVG